MRPAELDADQQGQQAAEQEEDQRREQELDADDLVIGREDVFAEEAQLRMLVGLGFVRKTDAHLGSSFNGRQ